MVHRKRKDKSAQSRQSQQADNLIELNRSLSGYAYHPNNGRTLLNPEPEPKKRSFSWKKFFKRTFVTIILVVLVAGGWLGWKLLSNELKIFGWKGLLSLVHPTKLNGEDTGHVNILIAGDSSDDPGHDGADLTDSIMLISLNTNNDTAYMLSIPRDLYVNIPGNGYAKINEAYQDGNQQNFDEPGYPAGGMGLLEETVSQVTGVPINYYALVDYSAVRDAVNAVGSITVNIQSDDPRGLYDAFTNLRLPNGENTLNGQEALNLARARGDDVAGDISYGFADSDFTRTQNQRLILLALKDKVMSAGTLSNPIKLGNLFDSLGNNVTTDMSLGDVVRAYDLTKKVPDSKITSAAFNNDNGTSLLTNYYTSSGEDALIPAAGIGDYSALQQFVTQLENGTVSSSSSTSSSD